jgi:cytochrome b subunit of formate dehydrogenase
MNEFFNLHTLIAFALGVMLSAMVKGWVSSAKSKL